MQGFMRWIPMAAVLVAILGLLLLRQSGHQAHANDVLPFQTIYNTDVTTAGYGGMRGDGTGTLSLAGVSGSVTRALLYWHGPTNSTNLSANAEVSFSGVNVTGENIGFSNDNCWGFANSQAYRADVTSLVTGNGAYSLSNFRKSDADVNGASLIVFFSDGDRKNNRDVVLFNGNDSNISNSYDTDGWNVTLAGIDYASGAASIDLHVGDGQTWGDDDVRLNQAVLASGPQLFDGDSVPNGATAATTYGGLWDIKSFDITAFLTLGMNTLTLTTGVAGDCLSLVVAAVNLPAGAAPPTTTDFVVLGGLSGLGQFDDACDGAQDNVADPEIHARKLIDLANDSGRRTKSAVDVRAFSYNDNWDSGQRAYGDCETRKSLDEMARIFDEQFDSLRRSNPGRTWTLLGHSLGGVVIVYWLGNTAAADDLAATRAVVTMGSPLGGVDGAAFVQFTSWGGQIAGDLDSNNLSTRNVLVRGVTKAPVFEVTNKSDGVTNGLFGWNLTIFGAGFWDVVNDNMGGKCNLSTCPAHETVITSSKTQSLVDRISHLRFFDDTKAWYGPVDGHWRSEGRQCLRTSTSIGAVPAMDTIHSTDETSDWAGWRFVGTAVDIVMNGAPAGGRFQVAIDNEVRGVFDLRAKTCEQRARFHFDTGSGEHLIRVTNLESRYLQIDGFEVRP